MQRAHIVSRRVDGIGHRVNNVKVGAGVVALVILWMLSGTFTQVRAEDGVTLVTFSRLAGAPLLLPAADEARAVWTKQLPDEVRAIDGRRVEITGYMLPLKMQSGRVTDFLLMRDQTACCYGKMPAANEYVVAQAPAGGLAVTMDIPVTVRGTLRVAPQGIDGALYQFYALENASAASAR